MSTATADEATRRSPHLEPGHDGSHRLTATRDAWQALVRLHALRGPVVLVEAGPRLTGEPVLVCVAERDFTIAAADRHAGSVDRCPVYVDADADDADHRPVYLLDLVSGRAPEATLAPDGGHRFVARRLGPDPFTA